MILQFTEPQQIENLYPLTLTRPAADLRCGILTVAEKWMHDLDVPANNTGFITRDYLQHPDARLTTLQKPIKIQSPCKSTEAPSPIPASLRK
jgi:hypothetical protein